MGSPPSVPPQTVKEKKQRLTGPDPSVPVVESKGEYIPLLNRNNQGSSTSINMPGTDAEITYETDIRTLNCSDMVDSKPSKSTSDQDYGNMSFASKQNSFTSQPDYETDLFLLKSNRSYFTQEPVYVNQTQSTPHKNSNSSSSSSTIDHQLPPSFRLHSKHDSLTSIPEEQSSSGIALHNGTTTASQRTNHMQAISESNSYDNIQDLGQPIMTVSAHSAGRSSSVFDDNYENTHINEAAALSSDPSTPMRMNSVINGQVESHDQDNATINDKLLSNGKDEFSTSSNYINHH